MICSAVPRSIITKSTMRIGIVSDTHNHMINVLCIVALLLGCDVALHGHDHRHTVEVRGQTLW